MRPAEYQQLKARKLEEYSTLRETYLPAKSLQPPHLTPPQSYPTESSQTSIENTRSVIPLSLFNMIILTDYKVSRPMTIAENVDVLPIVHRQSRHSQASICRIPKPRTAPSAISTNISNNSMSLGSVPS